MVVSSAQITLLQLKKLLSDGAGGPPQLFYRTPESKPKQVGFEFIILPSSYWPWRCVITSKHLRKLQSFIASDVACSIEFGLRLAKMASFS